ncbi:MAG: hypothetical protein WAK33_20015 [Silvibacterium sp.]
MANKGAQQPLGATGAGLSDRMTTQELENYAQSGALPGWFRATVGATD